MAFANPRIPQSDRVERRLGNYRAYAKDHYPNLQPEVLARLLRIERGVILSDADIVAIQSQRDQRVRMLAAYQAGNPDPGWAEILRMVMRRLGR